jgi:CHAD domain-containing protein
VAIDLRSVAKRLRKSSLMRGIRRDGPAVTNAARDIIRALLPASGQSAPVVPIDAPAPRSATENVGEGQPGLAAHLGQVVHKRIGQLVETMDFTAHEDQVEALHDLRVASRRLRAFVMVFEPILDRRIVLHVGKPLRRVTRAAGELRDLDVQIELVTARIPRQTTDAARAALEHLLERIADRRVGTLSRVKRRLRKVRLDDLSVGMAAALGETVARLPASPAELSRLAWSLLEPLVEDMERNDAAVVGDPPPSEALHELRISIKKLRYALELFQPLLGEDQKELVKRASSIQEHLGTHHDLFVISGLMLDERRQLEERGRQTLPFGLTVLRGELEAEEREIVSVFQSERPAHGYFRQRILAALGLV